MPYHECLKTPPPEAPNRGRLITTIVEEEEEACHMERTATEITSFVVVVASSLPALYDFGETFL